MAYCCTFIVYVLDPDLYLCIRIRIRLSVTNPDPRMRIRITVFYIVGFPRCFPLIKQGRGGWVKKKEDRRDRGLNGQLERGIVLRCGQVISTQ